MLNLSTVISVGLRVTEPKICGLCLCIQIWLNYGSEKYQSIIFDGNCCNQTLKVFKHFYCLHEVSSLISRVLIIMSLPHVSFFTAPPHFSYTAKLFIKHSDVNPEFLLSISTLSIYVFHCFSLGKFHRYWMSFTELYFSKLNNQQTCRIS